MPWINGQSSGTRIANGGGLVVVNADGSVSIAPATGTGVLLGVAPPATANKGLLSLGSGPFDGLAAGHFAGNANGTGLAMNFSSGFAGDPVLVELNGSPLLRLTTTGLMLGGSGHVGTLRLTTGDGGTTNASFDVTPQARLLEFSGSGLFLDSTVGTTAGGIVAGATATPLTVRGVALQTGDLFRVRDSASNPQFAVANVGSGAAPIWALRVRAVANAESMAQLHTLGAYTGRAVQYVDDAGVTVGWGPIYG